MLCFIYYSIPLDFMKEFEQFFFFMCSLQLLLSHLLLCSWLFQALHSLHDFSTY